MQGLTTALLGAFRDHQVGVMTPADPARHGASVCVASDQAQAMAAALVEHGVWAWNGQGRVRFSFHGYNDMTDVDRVVSAMRRVHRG